MFPRTVQTLALCAAILGACASGASASECTHQLDTSQAFKTTTTRSAPLAFSSRSSTLSAPLAHTAQAEVAAITGGYLLKKLAGGAALAVGQAAAGRLLSAIGFNPSGDNGLSEVRAELTSINHKLNELAGSVNELKALHAQSHYSNLVGQAADIVSNIKYVDQEISSLAALHGTERKRHARYILGFVCEHLLSKQVLLNERLVGTEVGQDNIIISASKAAVYGQRLWTGHQSTAMRHIVDYYALYEALLLRQRVEWWNAIGMGQAYIKEQIASVQTQVDRQYALLKPGLGNDQWIDTKHPSLLWSPIRIKDTYGLYSASERATIDEIRNRDFGGDWEKMGLQTFRGISVMNHSCSNRGCVWWFPFNLSARGYYVGDLINLAPHLVRGFRLPSIAEVQSLFDGHTGRRDEWLKKQASPHIKLAFGAFYGPLDHGKGSHVHAPVIWVNEFKTAYNMENGAVRRGEWDQAPWGVFAVAGSDPAGYWYR